MFSAAKDGLFDGNEQPAGYSSRSTSPLESACCRVTRSTGDPQKRREWTIRVAPRGPPQRDTHREEATGTRGRGEDQTPVSRETSRINLPRKTLIL